MTDQQQNSDEVVYSLLPSPGIKRDGTIIDGQSYTDGQWVRFQRGKPRKMGGFRRITANLTGTVRKVLVWSRKDLNSVFCFNTAGIENLLIDSNFVGNNIQDRTPSTGFTSAANNMWTADTQYDDAVSSKGTVILAHCNQSLTNIDDDTASKPYLALASSTSSFFSTITDAPAVSGGVFSLPPYTILYGSDGQIEWSDANQPQVWRTSTAPGDAGGDRVTGGKIVAGLPIRAGNIAALLWSLDSVIRMDYVGGPVVFKFSTLSTQSSILAQNSVIEYDGVYFWIGVDRFMYFDTAVNELPNNTNQNYFFDNLNYAHRQKIWATKVPRFGEVWWFYPRGDATECSHAIIFNVREKTWYDVELARSAGFYSQIMTKPVWATRTEIYAHEIGKNAVIGDNELAICSSFTTQTFGLPTGGVGDSQQGMNRWTRLTRVEPDFVQVGDMTCTVLGSDFAQGAENDEKEFTFSPNTGKIDMRVQQRHLWLKFESNTLNGDYEMGKVLIHTEPGDNRS